MALHYVMLKSNLGKWPELTSAVEHSQCLPINFNIFNDKKYRVASQLQQYVGRKCYFIMFIFLCNAYFTLMTCSTADVISLSTWQFIFCGVFLDR